MNLLKWFSCQLIWTAKQPNVMKSNNKNSIQIWIKLTIEMSIAKPFNCLLIFCMIASNWRFFSIRIFSESMSYYYIMTINSFSTCNNCTILNLQFQSPLHFIVSFFPFPLSTTTTTFFPSKLIKEQKSTNIQSKSNKFTQNIDNNRKNIRT